jgi:hypothetical protein
VADGTVVSAARHHRVVAAAAGHAVLRRRPDLPDRRRAGGLRIARPQAGVLLGETALTEAEPAPRSAGAGEHPQSS